MLNSNAHPASKEYLEQYRIMYGNKIKDNRLKKGLTKQRLSDLSGVPIDVIDRIETFDITVSSDDLYKIIVQVSKY